MIRNSPSLREFPDVRKDVITLYENSGRLEFSFASVDRKGDLRRAYPILGDYACIFAFGDFLMCQTRRVELMGMGQLPHPITWRNSLLIFHRRRLSLYKERYYRELWDIAPSPLLSRRSKAPKPGVENSHCGD